MDTRVESIETVDGATVLLTDKGEPWIRQEGGKDMIRGAGKSKAVAQDDEDRLVRYQVCGWTSQDGLCPAEALEDWNSDETNQDLRGWCTESFCVWPQEIELSFPSCTRIDDIEIVAHSFRTPRSVDVFVTGFQTQGGAYYIGRMSFDSNLLQDHSLNECKRARVDAYGTGLILRIPECYSNKRNLFDQASLLSVRVFGESATDLLYESPAPRPQIDDETETRSGTKLAVDTSRRGLRQRRRFEVITNNIDCDEREHGYDHAQMTEVDKALLSLGIAMNVINTTATPYRISETTAGFVGGLQDRVEKLLLLEEDCLAGKLDISQEELLDAVWRLQSAVDELLELGTALARFEALLLVEQDGGDVEACNKLRLQIESVACAAAEDFESIHGNCVDLAREPPMSARSDNFERELPQAAESRLYDASEEIRLTDEDKSSPVEAETRMSNGTFRSANTQYIAEEEEGEQKSNEQDSSIPLNRAQSARSETIMKTEDEEILRRQEEVKPNEGVKDDVESKTEPEPERITAEPEPITAEPEDDRPSSTGRSTSPSRGFMGRLWPRSPRSPRSPRDNENSARSNNNKKKKKSARRNDEEKEDVDADARAKTLSHEVDEQKEDKDKSARRIESSHDISEQKEHDATKSVDGEVQKTPADFDQSSTSDETKDQSPEDAGEALTSQMASARGGTDIGGETGGPELIQGVADPLDDRLRKALLAKNIPIPADVKVPIIKEAGFGSLVRHCLDAGPVERTAALECITELLPELVISRINGKDIVALTRRIMRATAVPQELYALEALLRQWYLTENAKEEPFHDELVYEVLARECCTSPSLALHESTYRFMEYLCDEVAWVPSTNISHRLLDELRTRPKPDPLEERYERVLDLVHKSFEKAKDEDNALSENVWQHIDDFFSSPVGSAEPHSTSEKRRFNEVRDKLEKLRSVTKTFENKHKGQALDEEQETHKQTIPGKEEEEEEEEKEEEKEKEEKEDVLAEEKQDQEAKDGRDAVPEMRKTNKRDDKPKVERTKSSACIIS